MRKLSLFLIALFIAFNCYAETNISLNTSLLNHFNQHSPLPYQNPFAIIYGGQDFSHPQIANAHDTFKVLQPLLIG